MMFLKSGGKRFVVLGMETEEHRRLNDCCAATARKPLMKYSGMFPTNFRQCEGTFSTPFTALASVTATITSGSSTSKAPIWDGNVTQAIATTGADGRPSVATTVENFRQTTVLSSGKLWAEPVTVYWQAEDLSLFPSAYAASLASAIGISFNDGSKAPEPAAAQGLTIGAKVGIAVGAVIFAALLGGFLVLGLLRRRRRQRHPEVPELSGQSNGFRKYFGGKWRVEADGNSQPVELDSKYVHVIPGPPVELDASSSR
jgi:hypothetical protein